MTTASTPPPTAPCLERSSFTWVEHQKVRPGRGRRRRPRTWPKPWRSSVSSSTAPTDWTTSLWGNSLKSVHAPSLPPFITLLKKKKEKMDPETLCLCLCPGPSVLWSLGLFWWVQPHWPGGAVCGGSTDSHHTERSVLLPPHPIPHFWFFFWLITPGNQRQICHFSIEVKSLQSSGQTAGLQPQLCSLLSGSVASKHAASSQRLHEFNCFFFSTKCTASVFLVSFHNVNLWHR